MNQKSLDKKKSKELDWEKVAFLFHNTYEGLAPKFGYETRKDTKAFDTKSQNGQLMIATCKAVVSHFLTQQRTELEQQKVKVVWNDVCEQIKQEARTELLEEIKTRVDTWGGFEDDGGNLCHYDSEILEWVNDLLNKKNEITNRGKGDKRTKNMTKQGWGKRFDELYGGDGVLIYDSPFSHPIEVNDEVKDFISQELSTFAKEVDKIIGEDEHFDSASSFLGRGKMFQNHLRHEQRQALTNLKKEKGI